MADAKVASSKVVGKARILQTQQHEACLRLIEAIKKRPIVYNSKSTEYRESVGKKIAWAEVQAELSLPTGEYWMSEGARARRDYCAVFIAR